MPIRNDKRLPSKLFSYIDLYLPHMTLSDQIKSSAITKGPSGHLQCYIDNR